MDIDTPLRELGALDITALRDSILELEDDAWKEDKTRQESFEQHNQTESVVLIFVDLEKWPNIVVSREAGWPRLSDVALPIMDDIISRFYPTGGTVIRAMAAKLLAGSKITPHVDVHPSFHRGHRIHIPITTNSRVRFMIDGRPYQFQVGEAYELNNQKQHSVMNKGDEDRITFIFDYIPPGEIETGST
jgi:hypothetical protein